MELLIPSTFAADERDMKARAVKYGLLARTASIFGVEKIVIYEDFDEKLNTERSAEIMEKYLNYAEVPPYLRKDLIPFDRDLKYANIMPALQTESHGYSDKFREAVVEKVENGKATLKAGLKNKLTMYGDYEKGERVTVKVIGVDEAQPISKEDIPKYWTYEVENRREGLGTLLEENDKPVIVTSAHGDDYREASIDQKTVENSKIVFGSAWRGIPSMLERGDLEEKHFDHIVNTVPEQNTKTVRTEEALFISFSRLMV